MSYSKLGFTSGQTLKAEHLNHIEDGIANAGGIASWNDLIDKPFGENAAGATITWDGNADGLVVAGNPAEGWGLYKVSDSVFTNEQIKNAVVTDSTGTTMKIADSWESMLNNGLITDDAVATDGVTIIRTPSATVFGLIFPEVGTYMYRDNGQYITSAAFPAEIKQIDEKYIPDSVKPTILHLVPEDDASNYDGYDYVLEGNDSSRYGADAYNAYINGATILIKDFKTENTWYTVVGAHYSGGSSYTAELYFYNGSELIAFQCH